MKKFFLTTLILLLFFTGIAQLNNGWIDYSKTYYKFKLAKDTIINGISTSIPLNNILCRITQPALAAVGLGTTPVQNFQLWRNGIQVRIYTSVSSGTLATSDFIEFWGEKNDGKPDKNLYRDTLSQLSDKKSLFSDTAIYFLTVNSVTANNLRYVQSANPVAGNVLPADNYFMRRVEQNFNSQINRGWYQLNGEPLYLSDFDLSEGWTSTGVTPSAALSTVFSNTAVYTSGPANSVTLSIAAGGNANYTRNLAANINSGSNVLPASNAMNNFTYQKDTIKNLPLTLLNNPSSITINVSNANSSDATGTIDQLVVGAISLTYPATFNFNNQQSFYFELQPSSVGNYLVITNFNNNGVAPILYDITNGSRYLGDISTAGQIKFALPASSASVRKFNLMSQNASDIINISNLATRNFVDLTNPANQANYIIISNPVLYNDGTGANYVDQYRQYRASTAGGSYNAKVYNIDELTDQFAFGISKHPAAIRDFIRYANAQFASTPKYVFIIGRGVNYTDYNTNLSNPAANQLNLVPTFGWPASDVLLAASPGLAVPLIPIGRIAAVNGAEVGIYLQKMKEYEQLQQSTSQTIADKGWMKNILFLGGPNTTSEAIDFTNYLNSYGAIAKDTSYGAYTETFIKSSNNPVQDASNNRIGQLFNIGLGNLTYFGHASSTTLAFNISSPSIYNNQGKYPFINISGCDAGDFFYFDPSRLTGNLSLSESFTFANQKGSIGFLADTYLGVENYLAPYNTNLFNQFCKTNYGGTVGNQLKQTLVNLGGNQPALDSITKMHLEEITFEGDPALKLNYFAKPDYAIEPQLIQVNPTLLSVANTNFTVDVKMVNLGKATNDSIRVTVNRVLPNGTTQVLYNSIRLSIKNIDSLSTITVPINPLTDKGLNKIIVWLDVDNKVAELSETNNTAEQDFVIYEDEITPVYPYNYSIINQQNITFTASTANPLLLQRQYTMQLDTTALFNSSFLKTYNVIGNGGEIEFKPTNITFTDSTVYYWRTSIVPVGTATTIWNTSSFIYLPTGIAGFNQSHYYQFANNTYNNIVLNNGSKFTFSPTTINYNVTTASYPSAGLTSQFALFENSVFVQGGLSSPFGTNINALRFYIVDSTTSQPWVNKLVGSSGLYGSYAPAVVNNTQIPGFFQFDISTVAARQVVKSFIDILPSGTTIAMVNGGVQGTTSFPAFWNADPGANLYLSLKSLGFSYIDSIKTDVPFAFIGKKGSGVAISQNVTSLISNNLNINYTVSGVSLKGLITSPVFGPAKSWSQFHYRGNSVEHPSNDSLNFNIIGISPSGSSTTLFTVDSTKHDFDISSINAKQYPYLQLQMFSADTINATPYQLRYWRLNYTPVAEGAIAPNILFQMKDTANQGELVSFKIAFKNISSTAFDSAMKFSFIITDNNNLQHIINLPVGKVLVAGDTLVVQYTFDTKNYPGNNTIYLNVNPNNAQPEQYLFNNLLFKNLYVKANNSSPVLDVTFDGVHILNNDIVAAKPHILVKLTDANMFLALADTSLLKVQVVYPDNSIHNYFFGDTMKFTPANLATGQNIAIIDFAPNFLKDGTYQLLVSGKNVIGNPAGALQYTVNFTIINKAMISNMLNYPNPFTTSTAFVFTITGSQIPQNMRIEILTISGKIVKEITKEELGPIHVGNNITEYKWDGTDMYGQKLANGVYLYRVLTNLNGKSLDKYSTSHNNTDQFFNKGYGKMVLIR